MSDCCESRLFKSLVLASLPGMKAELFEVLFHHDDIFKVLLESPLAIRSKIKGGTPKTFEKSSIERAIHQAKRETDYLQKNRVKAISIADEEYPYRLRECPDAPLLIFVKGDIQALSSQHMLSVVGTRKSTDRGRKFCEEIASYFSQEGGKISTVSGLALGIDGIIHKESLDKSIPTVAVLAHGFSTMYPAAHRGLAERILKEGGALVTEFFSHQKPEKYHFVQRNRIIAGLSDACIVVESAQKGGALITAQMAASYARDVFAVPGRINDCRSEGCNDLIKRNIAGLITSPSDIAEAMRWDCEQPPVQAKLFYEMDDLELSIVQLLRSEQEGVALNRIARELKIPVGKASASLLELEFQGIIRALPGNVYVVDN